MNSTLSLLASTVVFALVLVGCDAAGPTDTVILNSQSPIPPTIEYTFDYETQGRQQIGISSLNADTLSSILRRNGGFSRADVTSAQVERVVLERISDPGEPSASDEAATPKVFDYLTGATVYLGSDAESGTRIADASFDTTTRTVSLSVVGANADVTDEVQSGRQKAFLMLDAGGDVPDRRDRVRVTVDFRIELQGV